MSLVPLPTLAEAPRSPLIRSPANSTGTRDDLAAPREALDAGADVEKARFGTPPRYDAVDVEGDESRRRGTPPHVGMPPFPLARGADPTRRAAATGLTAEDAAGITGHRPATELFNAWKQERNR